MHSGQAMPSRPSPVRRLLRGFFKRDPSGGGKMATVVKHITAMLIAIQITIITVFL
ncbi:MAG: hypothetical protein ACYS80_07540 [Planctomycetota bacterium]